MKSLVAYWLSPRPVKDKTKQCNIFEVEVQGPAANISNSLSPLPNLCRSDHAEEERPPSHSLSNSKLRLQGLEEEEEEVEGDDEEEEEGSLTEKSHDEAPESPSPVTTGVYEEDEEEEETAPLAMSYEHTRRYLTYTDKINLQMHTFVLKCVRACVYFDRRRPLPINSVTVDINSGKKQTEEELLD